MSRENSNSDRFQAKDRPKGPPREAGRRGAKKPLERHDGAPEDIERFTPARTKPGLAARGAALDLLRLVRKGRSLDEALAIGRTFAELEGADRAFARELATTVLRRQGSLDDVIDNYLSVPLKPQQAEVRSILRLAAAQVILLDIPPHAAASTAVDLARERRETNGFAKLVNAIARRLGETGKNHLANVDARADTPGWLWRRLERTYGPATTRAIAAAHRHPAALDLSIPPTGDRAALAETLNAKIIGPQTIRRAPGGRIEDLYGFAEGAWWVQDLAATLPARLLGDVRGQRVLDLCAAPGGKTMQLAAAGAEVTAVDISAPRLERLRDNLQRTHLDATVLHADVMEWEPDAPFDAVLLDAPCSATGTIRRNPDLLWGKREEEVAKLVTLQRRMLDRALGFLAPGGVLVFATCSLLPDEGERQIEALLKDRPDLTQVPVIPDDVAGLPVIDRHGNVRCLPHLLAEDGGMDGFFAARLRKAD